jgi:hypothetical protein
VKTSSPRGSSTRADRKCGTTVCYIIGWGAWYPVDGQFEECARPYFTLAAEQDGTLGYKIANDFHMARMLRGLYTNPKLVYRLARSFCIHPQIAHTMLRCYYLEKSWDWQFQGDDPPMKLWRQTWCRNST